MQTGGKKVNKILVTRSSMPDLDEYVPHEYDGTERSHNALPGGSGGVPCPQAALNFPCCWKRVRE